MGRLLEQAEAVAPANSVPTVAARLSEMLGACEVNPLIADSSGRAVVRLRSTDLVDGAHDVGSERAEPLLLAGAVHFSVLRTRPVFGTRTDRESNRHVHGG